MLLADCANVCMVLYKCACARGVVCYIKMVHLPCFVGVFQCMRVVCYVEVVHLIGVIQCMQRAQYDGLSLSQGSWTCLCRKWGRVLVGRSG